MLPKGPHSQTHTCLCPPRLSVLQFPQKHSLLLVLNYSSPLLPMSWKRQVWECCSLISQSLLLLWSSTLPSPRRSPVQRRDSQRHLIGLCSVVQVPLPKSYCEKTSPSFAVLQSIHRA